MAPVALSVNIIYTLGCAVVSLIVIFLNPIIISVIYKDRQLRRQPSIIYIVNLALVDLCFAAVTFTATLLRFLHLITFYPLCLLLHLYLPFSFISASLLLMFTNSVDRFIFIRMSLKYHSLMNSKTAKRVAIAIWTYAMTFPLLPYVICDHFWNYSSCSDISATDNYRYFHVPVQAIFFITIVFTVLMFVSVFRVVKNSRRLRHVAPTRSWSVDSISTMASSPTLNTSTPSLPPILELIPYEHGAGPDLGCSTTNRLALGSEKLVPQRRLPCLSTNRDVPTTDVCLSGTKDKSVNIFLSSTRNISANVCLPTENSLPDLIMPQLWLDEATDNLENNLEENLEKNVTKLKDNVTNREENITQATSDAINETMPPTMSGDVRNCQKQEPTSRTLSVTPDLVIQSSDGDNEPTDKMADVFSRTIKHENIAPRRDVRTAIDEITSEISVIGVSSEPRASPQLDRQTLSTLESVDSINTSPQAVRGDTPSLTLRGNRKRAHPFKWKKTFSRKPLFYRRNALFTSQSYTFQQAMWPCRSRFKMQSTIPREPIQMVDFKLEKRGPTSIQECDTQETANYEQWAGTATTRDRQARNTLVGAHNNTKHLISVPAVRARRRSLSTSDNSSIVSLESSSSFSYLTTESTSSLGNANTESSSSFSLMTTELTFMSENSATSLEQTHHRTLNKPHTDATRREVKTIVVQRTMTRSVSESTSDSARTTARPAVHDLPYRSRLSSAQADNRSSRRRRGRPPRLHKISFNDDDQTMSPDSPRLSTMTSRNYSRSTSNVSSSSSVPFGISSYSGRDIRTLKILFIMFCVYIILWLPAFVIQVLRYMHYDISLDIALIVYTFGISNSVVNFFVYPMRIPKLRVIFKKLFRSAISDVKRGMRWYKCIRVGR